MKKILFTVFILGCLTQFHAQEVLLINGEKYSLNDFKEDYAKNIEYEGYENALNNYINYILLLQKAEKLKVDTTSYFQNLYASQNAEIKRRYLDEMIKPELDSLKVPNDEISLDKRIGFINKKVLEQSQNYIKTDSVAIVNVIKAAGEDFLNQQDSLEFKGNTWIFKTPTAEFTQQDFVTQLNFAQKQIKEDIKLSELVNNSIHILKNQFIVKDYQDHFGYYKPSYEKEIKQLRESILINYILETEVYQKYSGDELNNELSKYLKQHQDKYTWPVRYEAEIIRYYDDDLKPEIFKALKNNLSAKELEKKFNKENQDVRVVVNRGKFPIDHEVFGENFKPSEKIQEGVFRKTPTFIRVIKKLPQAPMTVQEASKILKEDYYNHLLGEFFEKLKKNAEIQKLNEN